VRKFYRTRYTELYRKFWLDPNLDQTVVQYCTNSRGPIPDIVDAFWIVVKSGQPHKGPTHKGLILSHSCYTERTRSRRASVNFRKLRPGVEYSTGSCQSAVEYCTTVLYASGRETFPPMEAADQVGDADKSAWIRQRGDSAVEHTVLWAP
jgi:hypothetical protein